MIFLDQKQRISVILVLVIIFVVVFSWYVNSGRAATFVESFATRTYIDSTNTTADWEDYTTTGHLVNGDWRHADDTQSPFKFETLTTSGAVAPEFAMIHDSENNPLIIYYSNIITLGATKWANAGTSVCSGGKSECWTNLQGTTEGVSLNEITFSDTIYRNLKVLRMTNGYPALAFLTFDASDYDLNYMQWTPDAGESVCGASIEACWTNAAGDTAGKEIISNNGVKYSTQFQNFDFELDSYSQPSIFWNEDDATNIKYFYTRWNGSDWTYADRVTVGSEEIATKVSSDNAEVEFVYNGTEIYFNLRYDDYSYMGKYNGNNWQDLAGTTFTKPATPSSDLTLFRASTLGSIGAMQKQSHIIFDSNDNLISAVGSYSTTVAETFIARWDGSEWDELAGTSIGTSQGAIDGMTKLFDSASDDLALSYVSIHKNGNIILILRTPNPGLVTTSPAEYYFTQWNGTTWVQSDGETADYEQATSLTSGYYIHFSSWIIQDHNGYPVFAYPDTPGQVTPGYVSKYSGSDITGADNNAVDRDTMIALGQAGAAGVFRTVLYFNPDNRDIYYVAQIANNTVGFSKFNYDKYDDQDQDLVSTTIAVPHNSALAMTSATLTVEDTQPAGTAITYYLSADGGSNWCSATSGVSVDFTTCSGDVSGDDLRWKANLTSGGEDSTPTIEYLYVDVTGKTEGTSGDITITATIEPELSLTLSSSSCDLGTFYTDKLTTCSYTATVATNARAGYIAYIREDAELTHTNATNTLTEVGGADNEITAAETTKEEYGVSTSQSGKTIAENTTGVTCANLDESGTAAGNTSMPATALSTTDQTFASALAPTSDETTLCHAASIIGLTEAGAYSHTVIITVVGNF